MLAEATRVMVQDAEQAVLVSRNPELLAAELNATALALDWQSPKAAQIIDTMKTAESFDVLVSWIHREGRWLLPHFEQLVKPGGRSLRIHSSAVGDPSQGVASDPPPPRHVARQNVVLGWIRENQGQRWLTDSEICAGVLEAYAKEDLRHVIVGQIK